MGIAQMNATLGMASKLVDDILAEDPVDFQDLHVGEEEAKQLILMNMTEKYYDLKDRFDDDNFDAMMVAIMSKLALENYIFYIKSLTKH